MVFGWRHRIWTFRSARENQQRKFNPHNGNGLFRPPWDSHYYRCVPGKSWSGLTRVVWELNPVKYREGGTLFISGSHKSAYPAPDSAFAEDSPIWKTYECPAGSVLFFTEALSHSASTWTNEDNDRLAIFNLYNTISTRWQSWLPHSDLLAEMHPQAAVFVSRSQGRWPQCRESNTAKWRQSISARIRTRFLK